MGPRLSSQFVPCGLKLQNSRSKREAGPCPNKRLIPHFQSQGDLPNYACTEWLLGCQEKGHHFVLSDVSLPIGLFAGIHLG